MKCSEEFSLLNFQERDYKDDRLVEVFEMDDQFWTTSLDVAEKFGKRHDNVLRDIKNLQSQDKEFYLLNFEEIIRNVQGGQSEYYIISRDGFSLLAMGFTGKEALQWKIKYIAAFNLMEKTAVDWMNVAKTLKSVTVTDLNMFPSRALYLLSAPSKCC